MLELTDIHTYYGDSHILSGVSLSVPSGSCVAVLGRNGAGKTTTLRSIVGLSPPRSGNISFLNEEIVGMPADRVARRGLSYVPEHRGIFPTLTVEEHLRVAAVGLRNWRPAQTIASAYKTFPRLKERRGSLGSTLSGGEQQMLALARALVGDPNLLILDEPSEGLAPVIVHQLARVLRDIKNAGRTILLVEQNFELAIGLADKVYVLSQGRIQFEGTAAELEANPSVKHTHLGV